MLNQVTHLPLMTSSSASDGTSIEPARSTRTYSHTDISFTFSAASALLQRGLNSVPVHMARLSAQSDAAFIAYSHAIVALANQLHDFLRFCKSEPSTHVPGSDTLSTNIAKAEAAAFVSDLLADEAEYQGASVVSVAPIARDDGHRDLFLSQAAESEKAASQWRQSLAPAELELLEGKFIVSVNGSRPVLHDCPRDALNSITDPDIGYVFQPVKVQHVAVSTDACSDMASREPSSGLVASNIGSDTKDSVDIVGKQALLNWLTASGRPRVPRGAWLYFRNGQFHHWSSFFEHSDTQYSFRYGTPASVLMMMENVHVDVQNPLVPRISTNHRGPNQTAAQITRVVDTESTGDLSMNEQRFKRLRRAC